jgi:alpha-galactosidase
MITIENNCFLLSGKTTSLLLHVTASKKIVTEYFGLKLQGMKEAEALIRKYPFAQGTTLAYDEKNPAVSLDYLKSDYSTAGRGDFSYPSLILANKDGGVFDFVYDSYEQRKPLPIVGLPTPHGASEELVIRCVEPLMKATLLLHYFVYADNDIYGRYVEIVNDNDLPLTISRAESFQLVLPNRDYSLVTLYGSWANENNREEVRLPHGRLVNESTCGLSSARHNPFFLLKEKGAGHNKGVCYGFNLVYSGNHEESLELDTFSSLHIQSGISPLYFRKSLVKGASFQTPMGIMAYSSEGTNGISHLMQRFVNDCVIPPHFKDLQRPIVYNNWEATTFKFNKTKLIALMKEAADLGVELFVLDDGWFGDRNDDSHGLGDWETNTKKIPGGLKALSDIADSLNLRFGIWMEPEMVNPASKLYKAHPDWNIQDGIHTPVEGRHQYVLDLTKKEVQDFIFDSVSKVLESGNISYLKWDCNRPMGDFPSVPSSFFHDYVLGLYSILSRLSIRYPDVLFENCASGGNRFDLGMLSYFPQNWLSDDTDSFQRLYIQSGAYLGYPLSVCSNHVAAKTSNQMLRLTSLDTKFDVASFGVLGYELDLNDLTPLDKSIVKGQISYYKEHRDLFQFGLFSELQDFTEGNTAVWESQRGEETMIGRYEKLQTPAPEEAHLEGIGFKGDGYYHYVSRQESISLKKFGHLINLASPVHLKEDGVLVTMMSKKHDMKSEIDEGDVSGNALLSGGVSLKQEWSGVGYSTDIRLVGDFGGRLYYLKKNA